ncbi:MAG: hypothetical protein UT11_C0064G0004 [Berkelbacteria bacterium GW2011_GWA2_38_9]|uniref:Nucleoside 2-deoxyribosyltransferase n=1 Tax=Berkelbacteria bacterium GW2011_GWA2_38_9 TaxID=1618334 RepID=A0A0G0L6V5_9BACT|nr:MAG: hypothetical protein UT11_C0064G0004 [Berkelbacteria bacterium GW2011_GWA2_38_9]
MKNNFLTICLLGPIPKGDNIRSDWVDWKPRYKDQLSKLKNIKFTDGDVWRDETQPMELVGHDISMIKSSDIIIVNGESKLGAGTSQEIVIAKYFSKPVIIVLPKNTHHRKTDITFDNVKINDWIHPFILFFSDLIVENLDESSEWINQFKNKPKSITIKDISIIDKVVDNYINKYDYNRKR